MSRLRYIGSLMLILGLAGCLVIYSANSVFSAITRVNEARLHNSIEVFTTSLYKLARIYVTEIYCEGWLSKTSWQNFPVVVVVCSAGVHWEVILCAGMSVR